MKSELAVEHKAVKGPALNNPYAIRRALLSHISLRDNLLIVAISRFWTRQAMELQPSTITQAINSGQLDEDVLASWRLEWGQFLAGQLNDVWVSATLEGAQKMQAQLRKADKKILSRVLGRLRQWRESRVVRLNLEFAKTQEDVAGQLVRLLGIERGVNTRQTHRVVRSALGLTRRQARSLVAMWDTLSDEGIGGLARVTSIVNNSTRLQTVRARRIARTELALAFNTGVHEQMREHIQENSMLESRVVKQWVTAGDTNVCDFCVEQESNSAIAFGDHFSSKNWAGHSNILNPPAHPSCRCVIEYRDVS